MPDGLTGQFGIALRCLQIAMTEQMAHCAYAHCADRTVAKVSTAGSAMSSPFLSIDWICKYLQFTFKNKGLQQYF